MGGKPDEPICSPEFIKEEWPIFVKPGGFCAGASAVVLYLDGNFLPAVFTQPLMAETLIPCFSANSVGDINSSVTCATMAFLFSRGT